MTEFNNYVQSLKRLYVNKEIDITKIKGLLSGKKITSDEYDYIVKRGE